MGVGIVGFTRDGTGRDGTEIGLGMFFLGLGLRCNLR
jgi:hypothetical protein